MMTTQWQDLTEQQQIEAEFENGARLMNRLGELGMRVTGAGWTLPTNREAAVAMLRAIEDADHLDQKTEEGADCYAADLRRRFGL